MEYQNYLRGRCIDLKWSFRMEMEICGGGWMCIFLVERLHFASKDPAIIIKGYDLRLRFINLGSILNFNLIFLH